MAQAQGTKIFLGSLPHCLQEADCREYMEQFGHVEQLYFMPDRMNNGRGWALVTYKERDPAVKAIEDIDGKRPFEGMTEADKAVEARFANQKNNNNNNNNNNNRHYANNTAAAQYLAQGYAYGANGYYYNPMMATQGWPRQDQQDQNNNSNQNQNGQGGPPGANLFLFHLPIDWTESDIMQHFQHFGGLLGAKCQKDGDGKNKGFGFVSFDNTISAYNASKGMNGFSVGGKFLKVQIKKGEEGFAFSPNASPPPPTFHPMVPHAMPMQNQMMPARYAPY